MFEDPTFCDVCLSSDVTVAGITFCGKAVGDECGCCDEDDRGCGDPSCEICNEAKADIGYL